MAGSLLPSSATPSVGCIYGLIDPRDLRLRYVGLTRRGTKTRLKGHIDDAAKSTSPRAAWVGELLNVGLKPEITVLEDGIQIDNLADAEIGWMAYIRSVGAELLNEREGGRVVRHSYTTRQKISKAKAGRRPTPEQRARQSAAMMGRVVSEETRKKISARHKGKGYWRANAEKAWAACRGSKRPITPELAAEKSATLLNFLKNESPEAKALRVSRMKATKTGVKTGPRPACVGEKISAAKKGWRPTPEMVQHMREAAKLRAEARRLSGWKMPAEAIERRTAKLRGIKRSEETRAKIRAARSKQVFSEETRRKLSVAHTGRKHTPETIAKMRESHSARHAKKKAVAA